MKTMRNAQEQVVLHVVDETAEPLLAVKDSIAPVDYKKVFVFVFVLISIVLALALAYRWFIFSVTHISTDNAYVETELYPVNSRIMGYVKEVPVSESTHVKKGDLLLLLDDTDFNIELNFKKAKLSKAVSDNHRAQILQRSHALSRADLENAQTALTAAQADYDGTLQKIKYTRILSPVDGTIGKKTVEPGQFVQPGQSLFVIVPEGPAWIKANYKETQLERIVPGERVDIFVDSYPHRQWHGHVSTIFPSSGAKMSLLPPENATGNFTKIVQRIPVKITIDDDSENLLRPGMSVQSVIRTE